MVHKDKGTDSRPGKGFHYVASDTADSEYSHLAALYFLKAEFIQKERGALQFFTHGYDPF